MRHQPNASEKRFGRKRSPQRCRHPSLYQQQMDLTKDQASDKDNRTSSKEPKSEVEDRIKEDHLSNNNNEKK